MTLRWEGRLVASGLAAGKTGTASTWHMKKGCSMRAEFVGWAGEGGRGRVRKGQCLFVCVPGSFFVSKTRCPILPG